MNKLSQLILILCISLLFNACADDYTPKPKGYSRIDLPERSFITLESDCPFTFEHNASTMSSSVGIKNPCWLNIDYPSFNCRIHLSYVKVHDNLDKLLEDSRTLVYKHTVKASAINQKDIVYESKNVYAKIYEIEGDAASSVQFYATDSLNHFLRGALYFNAASNADSLRPAIDYIREDVNHIVESLVWK